jgi:hypothetical protein
MPQIPDTTPLEDLPEHWQKQIRKLRGENRELRGRLKQQGIPADATLEELPMHWQKAVKDLRSENARYRTDRREATAELEALKAEVGQ